MVTKVKIEKRIRCARTKKNGKQCRNNRIGSSKYCESHGAFNPNSKRSRKKKVWDKIKTGKTSKVLQAGSTVSRLVEEVKKNKDYLDIDENIAIMTTIMRQSLQRSENEGGLDAVLDNAKKFFAMLEKVNRAILTKSKIEEGLKHKIDIEVIDVALKQMLGIVKEHVNNPLTLRAIADDFGKVRVHDLPMHGHKPRDEYLKQLEETSMETREAMGRIVGEHADLDNKDRLELRKRRKITFEMDK